MRHNGPSSVPEPQLGAVVHCGRGPADARHGGDSAPSSGSAAGLHPSRTRSLGPASHRLWETPRRSAGGATECGRLCAACGEKSLPSAQLAAGSPAGGRVRGVDRGKAARQGAGGRVWASSWEPPWPPLCLPSAAPEPGARPSPCRPGLQEERVVQVDLVNSSNFSLKTFSRPLSALILAIGLPPARVQDIIPF